MGRVRFNNYSDDVSSVNSLIFSSAPSDIISEPVSSLYCPSPIEQFPQFTLLNRNSIDSYVSEKPIDVSHETRISELEDIGEEPLSPESIIVSPVEIMPTTASGTNSPRKESEKANTVTYLDQYKHSTNENQVSSLPRTTENKTPKPTNPTPQPKSPQNRPIIIPRNAISPMSASLNPINSSNQASPPNKFLNNFIVDRDARQISAMIPDVNVSRLHASLPRSVSNPSLQNNNNSLGYSTHSRSNSDSESSSKQTKINELDTNISQPYFTGYLYKLGRSGTWNWRFFRFDGLFLTCMHKSTGDQMQPKWTISITDVEQIALLRKPQSAPSNGQNTDGVSKIRQLFRKATTGVIIPNVAKNDELTVLASSKMAPGTDGLSAAGIDMSRNGFLSPTNSQNPTLSSWNLLSPHSVFGAGGRYANMCFVIRTTAARNYILRAKESEDLERWVWLLVRMWQIRRSNNDAFHNHTHLMSPEGNKNPSPNSNTVTSRNDNLEKYRMDSMERKKTPTITRSRSVNSASSPPRSVPFNVTTPDGLLISVPPRKYSLGRSQPNSFGLEPLPRVDSGSTDVNDEETLKNGGLRRSDSIASFLSDDALTDIVSNPSVPRDSIRMSISLTPNSKQKPLQIVPKENSLMMDPLIGVNSPSSIAIQRNTKNVPRKIPPRKGSILANDGNSLKPNSKDSKRISTTSISWTSQYLPPPPSITPPPPPNYTPQPPRFTRPDHHLQMRPSESLGRLMTKDIKTERLVGEMSPNYEVMNEFRKSLGELLSVDPDVYIEMSKAKDAFATSTILPTPMLSMLSQNPTNDQPTSNPGRSTNAKSQKAGANVNVMRQFANVTRSTTQNPQQVQRKVNFPTPPREITRMK
ncbi:hypothetical protein HK098_000983 [Nowakowskiella sp. JEL0407]|nr:hypothetical protein HK098_000983 [Nowakowskiella sp. JEL0407]